MQQGCLFGAADRRRHAVDGRPLHGRRDVRVDVHHRRDRGVAEPFLNDLHVLPRFEQNRCVSVSQAVQGEHLGVAGLRGAVTARVAVAASGGRLLAPGWPARSGRGALVRRFDSTSTRRVPWRLFLAMVTLVEVRELEPA